MLKNLLTELVLRIPPEHKEYQQFDHFVHKITDITVNHAGVLSGETMVHRESKLTDFGDTSAIKELVKEEVKKAKRARMIDDDIETEDPGIPVIKVVQEEDSSVTDKSSTEEEIHEEGSWSAEMDEIDEIFKKVDADLDSIPLPGDLVLDEEGEMEDILI